MTPAISVKLSTLMLKLGPRCSNGSDMLNTVTALTRSWYFDKKALCVSHI